MYEFCCYLSFPFVISQEALAAQQSPKVWRSLDLEPHQRPPFKTQRSSSMPTPKTQRSSMECGVAAGAGVIGGEGGKASSHSPVGPCVDISKERSSRGSVSNESNILLDPDVLLDYPTQALLLTVLVRTVVVPQIIGMESDDDDELLDTTSILMQCLDFDQCRTLFIIITRI